MLIKIIIAVKNIIIDIFFPKTCFGCGKEGEYICTDCISTLEILNYQYCLCNTNPKRVASIMDSGKCPKCQNKKMDGLFFAINYNNQLIQKTIQNFKYPPLVKNLSLSFSQIIYHHFQLSNFNTSNFDNFIIIPVPLEKSREKWRGFNQAYEVAKGLDFLNIPIKNNCLVKTKKTKLHSLLSKKERSKNILNAFKLINSEEIRGKKILLLDDVYTTGATMEECAKVLKKFGAKRVFGLVIARSQ